MSFEDVDEQAFQDFLNESRDLMDDLEPSMLELENHPNDPDYLDEPFRILHSIKGMSSFFNLTPIKTVSHRLEDLLTEIREDRLTVNSDVIDALFDGADILDRLYQQVFSGEREIELQPDEHRFLEQLEEIQEETAGLEEFVTEMIRTLQSHTAELMDDPELSEHPVTQKMADTLSRAEARIMEEGSTGDDSGRAEAIFSDDFTVEDEPLGQSLKAMETIAREVYQNQIEDAPAEDVEAFENALDQAESIVSKLSIPEVEKHLETVRDELNQFLDTAGFGYIFCGSLLDHFQQLNQVLPWDESDTEADPSPAKAADGTGEDTEVTKTFRVEETKVDDFMQFVGELIVTGEMYKHLQEEIASDGISPELKEQFKNTNQAFKDLSGDLQKSLLDIRKLPMENLLKKYPVLARKISRQLDKEVELVLEGEDIKVDKSMIERLEAPLTHMVRNAVDHGIESPSERTEAGKTSTGTVRIEVVDEEDTIDITVEDDGAGIPEQVLRSNVVDMDIMSEEEAQNTDYDDLLPHLFTSGFSTKEEVTDVSGRGVGMDSVRSSIEALDGHVEIDSTPGEGTTFHMTIPKAQAVIVVDGLVVNVDRYQFIIPIEQVLESISRDKATTTRVEGKGEMLNLRDQLYPLFSLRDVLNLKHKSEGESSHERDVIMVLEEDEETYAISVDQIREQQKVVVKDMGPVFQDMEFVRGSAVMGDGRVCLVLNIEGLARLARQRKKSLQTA